MRHTIRTNLSVTLLAFVLLLIALAPGPAVAGDDLASRAKQAYEAGDWSRAAELYGALAQRDPDAPMIGLRHALALRRAGELERARAAFVRLTERGVFGPVSPLELARTWAMLERPDSALAALEVAAARGLRDTTLLDTAAAFSDLRGVTRFATVFQQARRNAAPCLYREQSRQLDFWVGEWDVYYGDQRVGTNSIRRELGGCLIFENWSGMTQGKSFNHYDPSTDTWRQLWVSDNGGVIRYEGRFEDGAMRFTSGEYVAYDSGDVSRSRMTLTPREDGTVRQVIERLGEGGQWRVSTDLVYVRADRESGANP